MSEILYESISKTILSENKNLLREQEYKYISDFDRKLSPILKEYILLLEEELDVKDIDRIFSDVELVATDKTLLGKMGQRFSDEFKRLASAIKKKFDDVVLSKLKSSKPVEKFYEAFKNIEKKILTSLPSKDEEYKNSVKSLLDSYYKYGVEHPEFQSFVLAGITFAASRSFAITKLSGSKSPIGIMLLNKVFQSINDAIEIENKPQQLSEVDLKNVIKNISTKVTKDKLLKSWKKAGSPKDKDSIIKILTKAGLNDQQLQALSQKTGIKLTSPEVKGIKSPMGQLGLPLKDKEDGQDQMELPIGKGYPKPAHPKGQLSLPLNQPSPQTELPFGKGYPKKQKPVEPPITPSFKKVPSGIASPGGSAAVPPVIPPVIKPPIIPTPKTRIPPVIGTPPTIGPTVPQSKPGTPPTLPTAVPRKPNILQKAWQGLSDLSKQSNKKMAQKSPVRSLIPVSTPKPEPTYIHPPEPKLKHLDPIQVKDKNISFGSPASHQGSVIAAARPASIPKVPVATIGKKTKSKTPTSKKPESPFREFVKTPQGKIKTYPLKENITKEQLKSLIKEVKKVVDDQKE